MAQSGDERQWVERARIGDSEAIGLLYELYFDRIYKYIYLKVGDPTDAEDITEGVFLKMIEAISTFQWQGASFASWLYRIAHNRVIDTVRHRTRHAQVPIDPVSDLLPSHDWDPHQYAEQRDFSTHLLDAVGNLTDLQSQVILLKFGVGMSNAEVAIVLERTEGAVKSLQYSALQNLNKLMSAKGFERNE